MNDPFQILGLSYDATLDEVKMAYRRLAKKYHPDVLHSGGNQNDAERFLKIQSAYEELCSRLSSVDADAYRNRWRHEREIREKSQREYEQKQNEEPKVKNFKEKKMSCKKCHIRWDVVIKVIRNIIVEISRFILSSIIGLIIYLIIVFIYRTISIISSYRKEEKRIVCECSELQDTLAKQILVIQSKNYDRGQTFGYHLDILNKSYTEGTNSFYKKEFDVAHKNLKIASSSVDWLICNETLRSTYLTNMVALTYIREKMNLFEKLDKYVESYRLYNYSDRDFSNYGIRRKEIREIDENIRDGEDEMNKLFSEGKFKMAVGKCRWLIESYENLRIMIIRNTISCLCQALRHEKFQCAGKILFEMKEANGGKFPEELVKELSGLRSIYQVREMINTIQKDGDAQELESDEKTGGEKIIIQLPEGESLEFYECPAGTFMMGSPNLDEEREVDELRHEVRFPQKFYFGSLMVAERKWMSVCGYKPGGKDADPKHPVQVFHSDAMSFIDKLNKIAQSQLPWGYEFSLPTEAQWEYVARFADKTETKEGNNPLGIKDINDRMEWCLDWYAPYDISNGENPCQGALCSTMERVVRGESERWAKRNKRNKFCSSAFRVAIVPMRNN